MDKFSRLVDDLNSEQKLVVESPDDLYVTACPGSGKTRVLTRKLAYQTIKYASSFKKNIAITYTNRAANEIKERLNFLNIDNKSVWVGTIHQFCLDFIVYPFKMNIPRVSKGFVIIDSYTQREYLKELNNELGLKLKQYELEKIDLSLSSNFEINELKHPLIAKKYHDILIKNKEIDFDMILLIAYKILSENNVANNIASNIRSIYIDEFQDTRELQYEVIGKLIKKNPNIQSMFVGDIDQAIYGSLNGIAKKVEEIEELTEKSFDVQYLNGCYRSNQRLVDFYSNFQSTSYQIDSKGQNKNDSGFINYDNNINKDALPNKIKNIIIQRMASGICEKDICIVAPQHYPLFSLGEYLKNELPGYNFDAISISPIKVNDHSVFFKLSILYFTDSGTKVRRRKMIANEIINILKNEFRIEIGENFIGLDLLNLINSSKKNYTDSNGVGLYKHISELLFHFLKLDEVSCPTIIKQYNFFIDEIEQRIEKFSLSSTILDFKKVFNVRKGITITTAHKVKGNEYDTVIAINLLKGIIPHWNDIYNSSDKGVDSANKLLYVICSRAKSHLYLFSEKGHITKNSGILLTPPEILNNIKYDYDS